MTSGHPRRLLIRAAPACACDKHQYLDAQDDAAGHPQANAADRPAHRSCPSYRARQCAGWPGAHCLFAEPAARPTADLVARSFGITADARGAVCADRLIITTANALSLALAWALARLGCAEHESPELLAAWAPNADLADPAAALTRPASAIDGALSQAARYGVRLGETEALLAEVVGAPFDIGSPEHA